MNENYNVFSRFYDSLTKNVEYSERADILNNLILKYKISDGTDLLDLACGTGSLSEEFAMKGYNVTGVDSSVDMLVEASSKMSEKNLSITYLNHDMQTFQTQNKMDVTLCTLDSLNHLDSFFEVKETFQNVFNLTKEGGLFIFDMNTPYKHKYVLGDNVYVYETESVFCTWQNEYDERDSNRVDIMLDFFEYDEKDDKYSRSCEEFSEKAYPTEKIVDALEECGFEVLEVSDEDGKSAPYEETERIVYVTRKN